MQDFYFKNKRKNEDIILVLRKHGMALVLPLLKIGTLLILILGGMIFFVYSNPILFTLLFAGLIFCFVWSIYEWLCWWKDIYILTNQRIINIDQKSLFNKRVSEASWDKIQDVTYEIKGILPTLFGYGTVLVQTASAEQTLLLKQIPSPADIQNLITEIQKNPNAFLEQKKSEKIFDQKEIGS